MHTPNFQSEWNIYLDILPKSFDELPLFFKDDELILLKGSPFYDDVIWVKNKIKTEYSQICEAIPEYG